MHVQSSSPTTAPTGHGRRSPTPARSCGTPVPSSCVCGPRSSPALPAATIAAPSAVAVAGGRRIDALERERAEQVAEEGAELARRAGFAAESLLIRRDGAPWRAIVEYAAEADAAMIVTGTRGRSRAVAAVLGSTAEGILRHAHRPVMVVPDT